MKIRRGANRKINEGGKKKKKREEESKRGKFVNDTKDGNT